MAVQGIHDWTESIDHFGMGVLFITLVEIVYIKYINQILMVD